MARVHEVKDLPMEDLVIGKGQVRTRSLGKEIDELAESIRVHGLLEPIVVAPPDDDGNYEILTGQRRYHAHQKLNATTIMSAILDEPVDQTTAKVISLTENLVRRDLDSKDLIDACTALYKKYGTIKAVSEETGLPYSKVSKYVKYDRLDESLKGLVDSGESSLNAALRAQDAASVGGSFDPEEGVKLAKELSGMSGPQQSKVVKSRAESPEASVDDIIEAAKTGEKITQVIVTLGAEVHSALQTYSKDQSTNQDAAAAELIQQGLFGAGYLEEDAG